MQKLQLSIPEPCHENWQQMTPTDKGRFCNACAKEVVDFSMMTDMQVLNYFSTSTHEKVCGRALPDQLNRTISRPVTPKKRLFWYWNYIVMFFMFFGKVNQLNAQGKARTIAGNAQIITDAQLNLIRASNVNNALAGKVAGVAMNHNKVINGKVIDKNGNPVSFALIKIKGATTDVYADANGVYSIKVNSNAVFIISGAGFIEAEVTVGSQSVINTVLEKNPGADLKEVVVTIGGAIRRTTVREANKIIKEKPVVIFKVKEDNTDLVIENAVITITGNNDIKSDTAINEKNGIYKFKEIKDGNRYFVKVAAANYQPNEFTIDARDFEDRKKEWEVLLRKKQVDIKVRSTSAAKPGTETRVRLGEVQVFSESKGPLYVVDGTTTINANTINPDDIETINVLQAPEATALFGYDGANGAIVVTTRKAKEKCLKEVVVTSDFGAKRTIRGMMGVMGTEVNIANQKKDLVIKADDQLSIYPNPVQRGNTFNISLKLKQTGLYQIQITDAAARVVLQKQIHTVTKEFTEKILPGNNWSSGVYYISIIDNKNKLVNKSSFIFN